MKPRPVIDFDHHSKEYAADPFRIYRELHAKCPVAWTDRHDGFWVVSRYEDVARVARDDFTFSSRHDLPNDGKSYTGITIPSPPVRSTPIEMDPPEFYEYRRLLNRRFAPEVIETLRPKMLEFASWCLDRRIESGEIDLVLDLANPVPAMMTLEFLGIPVEHWEEYAEPMHQMIYTPPESPERDAAMAKYMRMVATLAEVIQERKRDPREDLITYLVQAKIDGHPIPDSEVLEICHLVIAGGVDTTTALVADAFDYLDRNREARRRLIEDPALILSASEEFLRYFSPVQLLARTATKDVEIGGQQIHAGERVAVCWAAANHDEGTFERPEEIVLDRFPNRHAAFGLGAHRCLGSTFARVEIEIMLGEVLRRMPDYELVRDGLEKYESIGIVNGYVKMPARFTAARRMGA